ncbi:ABC transporter permease (plasmid) [Sinorhizobium numidicum]|uniref:ABC transporter permease n=1 Tax=Sinorhizobium numidicum TaxID=680248 RepID=A0ABY8D352_9HYPH|nr:ABC transporter permease [Sinorhizobium numidicum]WEX79320.1 ABC transporter permease [Sinorhizobium numidicum]WEX85309.1 ABC transporter permease [Sinorhizobium numidicum]
MRALTFIGFVLFFMVTPYVIGTSADTFSGGGLFESPSPAHPLGTDYLGRDMLLEILRAGSVTMFICAAATVLSLVCGLTCAALSSALPSIPGTILARGMDALNSIPSLIIAFVLIAAFGSTTTSLIVIITVVEFTRAYRSLKAPVIQIFAEPFVELSRIRGEGFVYLVTRDVWPNLRPYAAVELVNRFVACLMFLSAISLLGIGVQPPTTDWGTLIKLNATGLLLNSAAPLIPGLFILVASLLALFAASNASRQLDFSKS